MNEPIFLGLGKVQWELINSFSNWLAALGTIAAVVVSLWLAARATRLKCRASVGHRIVIEQGAKGSFPEIVVFSIVNTGERSIRTTSIGWRVGFLRWRRDAVQMFDHTQSSAMPVELNHGQEAQWVFPLQLDDQGWLSKFPKKMLTPHFRFQSVTLRACFVTSIGKTFLIKPERGLLNRLVEASTDHASMRSVT